MGEEEQRGLFDVHMQHRGRFLGTLIIMQIIEK